MKRILLTLLLLASLNVSASQYEYKVMDFHRFAATDSYVSELNKVGKDGWKLVSTERIIYNGTHSVVRLFLIRKKSSD